MGGGGEVGKTIFHLTPRGLRARAASLRGFLQISSLVSSVSQMRPAEARWQLHLIEQLRLVWEEWEKGVRTRTREDEMWSALFGARRNSINIHSRLLAACIPTGDGKELVPANANEKKNFLFLYRSLEVLLLEPGICLLFISPLEARQFFFAGSEAEIPPQGSCKCQPTSCLLSWLFRKEPQVLFAVFCVLLKCDILVY